MIVKKSLFSICCLSTSQAQRPVSPLSDSTEWAGPALHTYPGRGVRKACRSRAEGTVSGKA